MFFSLILAYFLIKSTAVGAIDEKKPLAHAINLCYHIGAVNMKERGE